jgi:hypothetical protein
MKLLKSLCGKPIPPPILKRALLSSCACELEAAPKIRVISKTHLRLDIVEVPPS